MFRLLPGSFVPDEDQGSFFVVVEAPDTASMEYLSALTRRVEGIVSADPTVQDVAVVNGFSMLDGQIRNNAAVLFVAMKPFDERSDASQLVFTALPRLNRQLAALEESPAVFEQVTGLESWFELPASQADGARLLHPTRHKMLLVTWLGSFPTISALIWVLWPVIGQWPLLARTAVLSALMVVLLTYVVMPMLVRWLSGWLFSPPMKP